ncbi:kinase-like protein [Rhizopogon salebrosus TDB-379]|nr:kinase-like protein [Rhizopogon salebrosus TDB-379]
MLKNMYLQLRKATQEYERLQMMTAAIGSQQGLTGPPSQFNAPNIPPSAQPTPSRTLIYHTSPSNSRSKILIPDLTALITRCSQDPVCGGTYGNIYRCIYHGPEGDIEVVVKAPRPQFISAEVCGFRKKLGIWKRMQHPNILKFMGTTWNFGPSVAMVAPWMVNGTLTSFLSQNDETLTLFDRLLLLLDIASGLHYLHTFTLIEDGLTDLLPVIHGDLTGTNVLIDSDGMAYLADFGLSGTIKKSTGMTYLMNMTCHPGAMRWTAPELLSGEESVAPASTQSDLYSFGSIMLQVLTGNIPWSHLTKENAILFKVVEGKIHPRPDGGYVTDQHWNFMTSCWSLKPVDRPSAEEALQFIGTELSSRRMM